MSQALSFAHARAWNLATTLMVCVIVFRASASDYGIMPTADYDGDPSAVIHEFDPFQR